MKTWEIAAYGTSVPGRYISLAKEVALVAASIPESATDRWNDVYVHAQLELALERAGYNLDVVSGSMLGTPPGEVKFTRLITVDCEVTLAVVTADASLYQALNSFVPLGHMFTQFGYVFLVAFSSTSPGRGRIAVHRLHEQPLPDQG